MKIGEGLTGKVAEKNKFSPLKSRKNIPITVFSQRPSKKSFIPLLAFRSLIALNPLEFWSIKPENPTFSVLTN